jgi:DNA-binding CsgD family transcriptional regulator
VAHDVPLSRRPLVVEGRASRLIVRLLSDPEQSCLLLERVQAAIAPISLEEPFALTGREAEVMAWVAQGKSNADVAMIVQAQPRTIEKHLERIYKKLGVDNRFAAILAVMSQSERN